MSTALPLGPSRSPFDSLVLADLLPRPVALSRTAVDTLLVLTGTLVVTVLAQVAVPGVARSAGDAVSPAARVPAVRARVSDCACPCSSAV